MKYFIIILVSILSVNLALANSKNILIDGNVISSTKRDNGSTQLIVKWKNDLFVCIIDTIRRKKSIKYDWKYHCIKAEESDS